MNSDTGVSSQNSQSSSCGSNYYDDLLDLDLPPSCSPLSFSLPRSGYRSQLFLPKTTQRNEDIDSGFDFTSSSSYSQSGKGKSPNGRAISSQSTVSASDDTFDSDESLTTTDSINYSRLNENSQVFDENNESNFSENVETGEDQDEEMPLSGVDKNEKDEEQSQQTPPDLDDNITDSVLSEIDPILRLFAHIRSQYSDCAFAYALAANMCKDIYPKNSYISLKTALLLSIVSCDVQSNSRPISIMAITRDSASASEIMRHIGNFAKRFICISDDLKFNGKSAQTKKIEANSLLMARNGICFIGDWLALKVTSLNYLQNVVDSGRVTADATSNIEYALKCGIWMYWTCSAKKMSKNQKDLSIISKLFGIPVVLDDTPSDDVIDFLLAQCSSRRTESASDAGADDDGIDDHTMKAYLNFASQIPTEFDEEALAMLKYYFVVTRGTRPNILTAKSFDILQRMSECHAKLCLRSEVLKIDVTVAIELFEQFVLNTFAGQVVTKPIPNMCPSSYQQVDDNMREFTQWLDGYLSNINENVHTFFQEDF